MKCGITLPILLAGSKTAQARRFPCSNLRNRAGSAPLIVIQLDLPVAAAAECLAARSMTRPMT
jgi:hypothetical protein